VVTAGATGDESWVVVVPVKELHRAKTRLAALDPHDRADISLAMTCDVVLAALECPSVEAVVVTTNDTRAATATQALGALVVADSSDSGLNAALTDAARVAAGWHPRAGMAALSSDLPAIKAGELSQAFSAASTVPRAFVPDWLTVGTTMLTAARGVALDPRFGADSREQHLRSGAIELMHAEWIGLRRDVDTDADLQRAAEIGVGPHTSAVLARLGIGA
jgi:2-phospho-L-lactate guanylyltransferase